MVAKTITKGGCSSLIEVTGRLIGILTAVFYFQ